jgi:hypothetical protein
MKCMLSLFLAMAYIRSFFKMRTILTGKEPYPEKYLDALKWFFIIIPLALCLTIAISNGIWYYKGFKNTPESNFNFNTNTNVSTNIYYGIMSFDFLIALLFCYTVVRVWIMLSRRRYGFIVKKNIPSMVIKLTFNSLNILANLLVMFRFT